MITEAEEGKSKNRKRGRLGSETNIYTLHKVLLMEEYTSVRYSHGVHVHLLVVTWV